MEDVPTLTVEQYAHKIAASWRRAAQSIIEAGSYLLEAEENLSLTEYRELQFHLVEQVGISASVSSKLRMIAKNPVLTSPSNLEKLPPSYATLYWLSGVDEDQLSTAFENNDITSETQLKDVERQFSRGKKPKSTRKGMPTIELTFKGDFSTVPERHLRNLEKAVREFPGGVRVVRRKKP